MKMALAKRTMAQVAGIVREWRADAMILAGVLSVAYGARQVYAPAGWIILGVFLLAFGVLVAKGGK